MSSSQTTAFDSDYVVVPVDNNDQPLRTITLVRVPGEEADDWIRVHVTKKDATDIDITEELEDTPGYPILNIRLRVHASLDESTDIETEWDKDYNDHQDATTSLVRWVDPGNQLDEDESYYGAFYVGTADDSGLDVTYTWQKASPLYRLRVQERSDAFVFIRILSYQLNVAPVCNFDLTIDQGKLVVFELAETVSIEMGLTKQGGP